MDATAVSEAVRELDIQGVMRLIPHRYPFLMVDRITGIVPDLRCVGIKNVTINEPFFQGHFPGRPVMPGVMIIEAMAQTAAALVMHSLGTTGASKLVYFMTLDNARFRRPVVPGDQLMIHVELVHARRNVWKFSGEAKVEDKLCAEAVFAAMIVDN